MKSKLYWGVVPLTLFIILNIGLSLSLKTKSEELSSKILSQRKRFISLRKDLTQKREGRDKISEYRIAPIIQDLTNQVYCRLELKDNFVIAFNKGKYIMADAEGVVPFHAKDFRYRILERGSVELKDEKILLRNEKSKELKTFFMVRSVGVRGLYAYGDVLMPKGYCEEIQLHLYNILTKEME